jgi:transcriptional regulator with XRE-family HTH domain
MSKPKTAAGETTLALRQELGRKLQRLREARGLTQLDLANRLGKAYYGLISQIETGVVSVPKDTFAAYAEALDVEAEWFVFLCFRYYRPYYYAGIFGDEQTAKLALDPTIEFPHLLAPNRRNREVSTA